MFHIKAINRGKVSRLKRKWSKCCNAPIRGEVHYFKKAPVTKKSKQSKDVDWFQNIKQMDEEDPELPSLLCELEQRMFDAESQIKAENSLRLKPDNHHSPSLLWDECDDFRLSERLALLAMVGQFGENCEMPELYDEKIRFSSELKFKSYAPLESKVYFLRTCRETDGKLFWYRFTCFKEHKNSVQGEAFLQNIRFDVVVARLFQELYAMRLHGHVIALVCKYICDHEEFLAWVQTAAFQY